MCLTIPPQIASPSLMTSTADPCRTPTAGSKTPRTRGPLPGGPPRMDLWPRNAPAGLRARPLPGASINSWAPGRCHPPTTAATGASRRDAIRASSSPCSMSTGPMEQIGCSLIPSPWIRPGSPPWTPGSRARRATALPSSTPSGATRNRSSLSSTPRRVSASRMASTGVATHPSPGCPAVIASITSAASPPNCSLRRSRSSIDASIFIRSAPRRTPMSSSSAPA